ncbi:MAG: ABC transporter permease [Bryobacterales bacterium]|nr:ABC transporter permease [Bryobacterales bacterium]MBV9400782.1 ABC transporter permease [Bryobacterales bacterium]
MRQRLRKMIQKEFRQTTRDPRMRAMLFLPPLIQLLIFGFAVNLDVENARIAWMDQDRTPESRELLSEFEGSGRFAIVATPASEAEMQRLLDRGTVDGVIRVLPGFAHDINRGRTTAVQVLLDGTNSNTASIVSAYAGQAIQRYAGEAMADRQRAKMIAGTVSAGEPLHPAVPRVETRTRVWFNPDLRSRNYFVPGVVVNIIMLVTLSMTAMAIVREKEIGTMEQLMVTPIRPVELILGKTLPFVIIGFWDMILVVGAALLIFRVPFAGNFGLLCVAALFYILTTLGAGLFISTVSRTQQQANMSTFLFFQPFMMLSGFTFPIRNMPQVVQWCTYINPMRYFMEIVRGIFLKGSGIDTLWPNFLALALLGVIVLSLAVQRFHKHLD